MAIDVNIFIQNKNDDLQKALAIFEIAKDDKEAFYYIKKHSISNEISIAAQVALDKLNSNKISFKDFNNINVDNWKTILKFESSVDFGNKSIFAFKNS